MYNLQQRQNCKENLNLCQLAIGGWASLAFHTDLQPNSLQQLKAQPRTGPMIRKIAFLFGLREIDMIQSKLTLEQIKVPSDLEARALARDIAANRVIEKHSQEPTMNSMQSFLKLNQRVAEMKSSIGLKKLREKVLEVQELVKLAGSFNDLNSLFESLEPKKKENKPEETSEEAA